MGRQRVILQSKQRVPVSPEIVHRLGGNVTAAYYYTQLLYYDRYSNKDHGWFDRTSKEVEEDIGLSKRQQEHSRKILSEKGWIETRPIRGGYKPTMMFRVLVDYSTH